MKYSTSSLDAAATKLKRRAEFLERFKALHTEDPEFAAEFIEMVGADSGPRRTSNYDIIVTWFKERGNTLATIEEIMAGASLGKHSVRQVLYRQKPDGFERGEKRERQTTFRLRTQEQFNLQ